MCWAATGVRGDARMLSPAAEGWRHPPRRDGTQLCQHIHILVSFNPRSNCSLVDVRYLWGPGGASSVGQPPACGWWGKSPRGSRPGRGGASKHRLPDPREERAPRYRWGGHRVRACSCALCLQRSHHIWLLEANPPESLRGPALSKETLDLPTIWKISMFALGLSLDPAPSVWPGSGLLCVCVSALQ